MAVINVNGTTPVTAASSGNLYFVNSINTLAADSGLTFSFAAFGSNQLQVNGSILGTGTAVFSGAGSSANSVNIGAAGTIFGESFGLFMRGNQHFITNAGLISSSEFEAVTMIQGTFGRLNNTGTISGGAGVSIELEDSVVTNSGEINAVATAADFANGASSTVTNTGQISGSIGIRANVDEFDLTNSGDIIGISFAIAGGDGVEEISNAGRLVGDVNLEGGNDFLDSRNGEVDGRVFAGAGDDTVILGSEDNFVDGRAGADMIRGGGGDDEIQGGSGDDELRGGAGDDDIIGEDSNDEIYGGHGEDILRGNSGADRLFGGTGNDVLAGGSGDDRMNGGRDDDVLTGNGGADVFIFNRQAGHDEITDFNDGVDLIDLRAFNVTAGDVLAATSVVGGNSVIDLDALGGNGSIVVEGDTSMSAGDFLV